MDYSKLAPFSVCNTAFQSVVPAAYYFELMQKILIPVSNDKDQHDLKSHIEPAIEYVEKYDKDFMFKLRDIVLRAGVGAEKLVDLVMFEFSTVVIKLFILEDKDADIDKKRTLEIMRHLTGLRDGYAHIIMPRLFDNIKRLNLDKNCPALMRCA